MNSYGWDQHIGEIVVCVYYKNGKKRNLYFKKYKNAERKAERLRQDHRISRVYVDYIEI